MKEESDKLEGPGETWRDSQERMRNKAGKVRVFAGFWQIYDVIVSILTLLSWNKDTSWTRGLQTTLYV